jgi:hypothetical protein
MQIVFFSLTQATCPGRFLMRSQLTLPRTHLSLGSNSSVQDFTSVIDETLARAHRLYSFCNPALVVQRCVRGHFGRRYFRKHRIRVMMPTLSLQRWYSCRAIRFWKAQQADFAVIADDNVNTEIRMLPFSGDRVVFENLASASDLYFLPSDVARLRSLLDTISQIFPGNMLPQLEVSNLVLLNHGPGNITQWIPYFHVLVKREHRQRSLHKGTSLPCVCLSRPWSFSSRLFTSFLSAFTLR